MEKLRPVGSTGEPLTAAAGELGLSEDSHVPEAEERGGMGQGASHPRAGPARVSAQVPARSPPQVRAGSKRHLLDCSVRCRTTEVKAPRPCGERAARRKAYSVLGFRSSTTKAVAGSKVLATWGRGEERDPDGERDRQTDIRERDRHRPRVMEMEKREVENVARDGAKRRRKRGIQAPSQQDRRAAQSRCLGRGEGASAIPSPTPPTHLSAMVAFPVEELVFDDALLPRGAPGEPDARL